MRYYLSSYEIGTAAEQLVQLVPNGLIAYVPNARDFSGRDSARHAERSRRDIAALEALSLDVRLLDLGDYFERPAELRLLVEEMGALYVSGGNTFILRQAMRLSGLDAILETLRASEAFLYAGYSAAGCVLSRRLDGYEYVDPVQTPYPQMPEAIWEGLGHISFHFVPHWQSDHPESAAVETMRSYCESHAVDFRLLRDGEVLLAWHGEPLKLAGSGFGKG